jgi:peroxiredoxin
MKEAPLRGAVRKVFLIACFFLLAAMGTNAPAGAEKTKAPDFSLKDLSGKNFSLSSLKGKVIILNFWSITCPPCLSEMSSLNRLHNEMKSRGLEVVAVSSDRSVGEVNTYLNKKGFGFQIIMDDARTVARLYTVFSLPTTFLIDRNGFIVEKFFGAYDWADPDIRKKIEKLL